MAQAKRDENRVTTLLGVSSIDLITPTNAAVNPATGALLTEGGAGGTQYADGAARGTATGTLLMVDDGTNVQSALGTTAGVLKVDLSATTANATAVKVDGSAVTQPVSGTVTVNPLTNSSVVKAQLQDNAGTAITLGQKAMTASVPVVLASDQTSIPVAATLSAETTKVIGTVNQGTSPWVTSNATTSVVGNGAAATAQRVTIANDSTGILAQVTLVPTVTTVSTVTSLTQMNGQAISMGTGVRAAGTQRVTIATDDVVPSSQSGTWTVQPGNTPNTTPWLVSTKDARTASAPSTVSVGVASSLAVASNASRKGLILRNTSTSGQTVSLAFSNGSAVANSGSVLYPQDVFQMSEYDFTTGQVNAISSASSGALSIQEFT